METQAISHDLYLKVDNLLKSSHAIISTAEIHGMISGFVCSGAYMQGKSWLDFTLGFLGVEQNLSENRHMLIDLYEKTIQAFKSDDFSFELLLPDDNTDIRQRVEALSQWCQGFVMSFNLAGVDISTHSSEDIQDSFIHMKEFTEIDFDFVHNNDEEDEKAYMELVEYLRVCAMLFFEEFACQQTTLH